MLTISHAPDACIIHHCGSKKEHQAGHGAAYLIDVLAATPGLSSTQFAEQADTDNLWGSRRRYGED
jgi:hypothetical protein